MLIERECNWLDPEIRISKRAIANSERTPYLVNLVPPPTTTRTAHTLRALRTIPVNVEGYVICVIWRRVRVVIFKRCWSIGFTNAPVILPVTYPSECPRRIVRKSCCRETVGKRPLLDPVDTTKFSNLKNTRDISLPHVSEIVAREFVATQAMSLFFLVSETSSSTYRRISLRDGPPTTVSRRYVLSHVRVIAPPRRARAHVSPTVRFSVPHPQAPMPLRCQAHHFRQV